MLRLTIDEIFIMEMLEQRLCASPAYDMARGAIDALQSINV